MSDCYRDRENLPGWQIDQFEAELKTHTCGKRSHAALDKALVKRLREGQSMNQAAQEVIFVAAMLTGIIMGFIAGAYIMAAFVFGGWLAGALSLAVVAGAFLLRLRQEGKAKQP